MTNIDVIIDRLDEAIHRDDFLDRPRARNILTEFKQAVVKDALANQTADLRWRFHDREYSIEDIENDLDNDCYDNGKHVVRFACAKHVADEYYIWDVDGERVDGPILTGPFKTEEEAKQSIK